MGAQQPRTTKTGQTASRFHQLWHGLTEPHAEVAEIEPRRQARLLAGVLLALLALGIVVESATTAMLAAQGYVGYRTTIVGMLWLGVLYALSRGRRFQAAAVLFVVTASLLLFAGALVEPLGVPGGYLDYLMLPIWLGGVFLSDRGLAGVIGANLAGLLAFAFFAPQFTAETILVGPFTFVAAGSLLMFVLRRHRNQVERDRRAELEEKEERYRTLVEQIPAITYLDLVDPDSPAGFRPLYLSPQFETWLGFSIEEYRRSPEIWREIVHPDDRSRVLSDDERLYAAGHGSTQEYRLTARDGRVRWVHDNARARHAPDGRRLIQGILLDITARVEAEERIRREATRAQALLRVAGRLSAQLDLDSLLAAMCEETAQALAVPVASVWLYDEKRRELRPAAGTGDGATRARLAPIPRALYDQIAGAGEPVVIVPDIREVPDLPSGEKYREANARTLAFASLLYEGALIGTLNALTVGETRTFNEDERLLLRGLADQAALAIVNTRLYKDARRRLEHLQALRAIDVAIASNRDLQETLAVLLRQITERLEVDAALVLLLDASGEYLEFAAGRGFRTPALQFTRLPVGQGQAGLAAQRRAVVGLPDLPGEPQAFAHAPLLAQEGFISYYAAPLIADEKLRGVLEVFHRWPLDPDAEWLAFLEALAGQAAIAIDSTSLFSDLQRANADLSAAYDATIEGWSRALDLRDRETEGHTQRVTEMTLRLARAAGLPEADLVHIRRGALLHDIGKMGIPDNILNKPGALSEAEWVVMRRHPTHAYEMLWPIAYLRPALDIPWCHHEKWDGTGYPRGLQGEAIPQAARLFAVVDVWDALRSNRPYRAGWPEARVRAYLREQAGSHFDPQAVAQFLKILDADGRETQAQDPAQPRPCGPAA